MMSYRDLLQDLFPGDEYLLQYGLAPFYIKREAKEYLGTLLDEIIPRRITHFINKLRSQKEMEEKDFTSFHQDLKSIENDRMHNALVYFINFIVRQIYHSYEAKIQDSVKKIKEKSSFEEKTEQKANIGLLNVYLLNKGGSLPTRNFNLSCFPGLQNTAKDIFEYLIPLGINALRLTNKLPKEGEYCGLDLSKPLYPKEYGGTTEEIPLHRGIKNKNDYAPFYKHNKINKGDYEDTTYVATNGKKFLYIRGASSAISPSSVMASKIATFVSNKHFSSERRLSNQLTASKQLPAYKISFVDRRIRDEMIKIIEQEKRIYVGIGIINEVLNFVYETDINSENYGFSGSLFSPESFLCKIDFDSCNVTANLLKKDYERDRIKIIYNIYEKLPHVFLNPIFVQEMLYTRLKLSLLTKELNNGFAQKASDDKDAQKELTKEATSRANIAFELFLENKNSADFLIKNPNILNTILQESIDYANKHFDEPGLSEIKRSLQLRFKEIHNEISEKLKITLLPMELEKEQKKLPEKVEFTEQTLKEYTRRPR
jgi:hypothetical protein